jgi:hypothetical protein
VSLTLKPGARLFSAVCTTELMVVKTPKKELAITVGGVEPLLSAAGRDTSGAVTAGHDGGCAIGKRYVDESGELELLCSKAGPGVPAVDGVVLSIKDAKNLPASD